MVARIAISLLGLALLAPTSCVSRLDEKSPQTSGVGEPAAPSVGAPAAQEATPTPTDSCADQACVSTTDCCKGFVCGFDQERSRVQRYCMSG
jgi:hypothetical protein